MIADIQIIVFVEIEAAGEFLDELFIEPADLVSDNGSVLRQEERNQAETPTERRTTKCHQCVSPLTVMLLITDLTPLAREANSAARLHKTTKNTKPHKRTRPL